MQGYFGYPSLLLSGEAGRVDLKRIRYFAQRQLIFPRSRRLIDTWETSASESSGEGLR